MCGIFGLVAKDRSRPGIGKLRRAADLLFRLSESRGKEAAGIALLDVDAIRIHKEPQAASRMIGGRDYAALFETTLGGRDGDPLRAHAPLALIGHSRLVTTGGEETYENNQPVITSGIVGVHNGIVVNHEDLWRRHGNLQRRAEVDSEALFALLGDRFSVRGDLPAAMREVCHEIEGTASVAAAFAEADVILAATNNGSLYCAYLPQWEACAFASEELILRSALRRMGLAQRADNGALRRLEPLQGCLIRLEAPRPWVFSLVEAGHPTPPIPRRDPPRRIVDDLARSQDRSPAVSSPRRQPVNGGSLPPGLDRQADALLEAVGRLRRCRRCILPETVPFIEFDADGVCNFCRSHRPWRARGVEALAERLAPYRSSSGRQADCIVALSGGRDSSYGLHLLKTTLGMNPVAYTYDWGMVTDLARRNIARLCGRLGVEHILVSADIRRKRAHIRKNVLAWLRRPDLGLVPLFMAGDKAFFYHANRLKRRMGIRLDVWSVNPLERTEFKVGFCGIPPEGRGGKFYKLRGLNKFRLAAYYGRRFLANPAFLNASLWDTFLAFLSYYFIPHEYVMLYEYVPWDEAEIQKTLDEAYRWEHAPDTTGTWRIGDGTAPFYNYIYLRLAGFTEHDAFRSNQIRQGAMTRESALARTLEENRPRWGAIRWYCQTIGVDFADAIRRIDALPRLY